MPHFKDENGMPSISNTFSTLAKDSNYVLGVLAQFLRTNCWATSSPAISPKGLKACAKFKRWVAVSLSPKDSIYGFAAVSKNASPNVNI